jgi:hypothetical protein
MLRASRKHITVKRMMKIAVIARSWVDLRRFRDSKSRFVFMGHLYLVIVSFWYHNHVLATTLAKPSFGSVFTCCNPLGTPDSRAKQLVRRLNDSRRVAKRIHCIVVKRVVKIV